MRRIAMQAARVLDNAGNAITVADRKFNVLELLESGYSLLGRFAQRLSTNCPEAICF